MKKVALVFLFSIVLLSTIGCHNALRLNGTWILMVGEAPDAWFVVMSAEVKEHATGEVTLYAQESECLGGGLNTLVFPLEHKCDYLMFGYYPYTYFKITELKRCTFKGTFIADGKCVPILGMRIPPSFH